MPAAGTKKKIPWSTWILGALGGAALLRAAWHPHRAVVREGGISDCAGGGNCDPSLEIAAPQGTTVYATAAGRVLSVGPSWVHVLVGNEPVILSYSSLLPSVAEGNHLWRGQKIGTAGPSTLRFAVFGIDSGKLSPIDPSAWLASRGYRVARKYTGKKSLWCEAGRHLQIPKAVHDACHIGLPERSGFSLLPVSIEQV